MDSRFCVQYGRDKLLKRNGYLWLSRVPETITEARALVEKPENEILWVDEKKAIKQPHLIQITEMLISAGY